jgi:hypothetical protein
MISIQPLQLNWPMPWLGCAERGLCLGTGYFPGTRASCVAVAGNQKWRLPPASKTSGHRYVPSRIATDTGPHPSSTGPPPLFSHAEGLQSGPSKKSPPSLSPTIPSLPDPPPPSSASIPSPPLILRSPFIPFQFCRSIPAPTTKGNPSPPSNPIQSRLRTRNPSSSPKSKP